MSTGALVSIKVIAVFVILFLFLRKWNRQDRRELEEELNQDYEKPHPTGTKIAFNKFFVDNSRSVL